MGRIAIATQVPAAQRAMIDCAMDIVRSLVEGVDVRATPFAGDGPAPAGTAATILAFDDDAGRGDPIATVFTRWRARIARIGPGRVLLCNLPRATAGDAIRRVREINRMAIDLSRESGLEVVDIDRRIALTGASDPAATIRWGGAEIAAALLDGPLPIDGAIQARALAAIAKRIASDQ